MCFRGVAGGQKRADKISANLLCALAQVGAANCHNSEVTDLYHGGSPCNFRVVARALFVMSDKRPSSSIFRSFCVGMRGAEYCKNRSAAGCIAELCVLRTMLCVTTSNIV